MPENSMEQKDTCEKMLFPKKSIIFSENMGVCRVDDITGLSVQKINPVSYYVLRSVYQKDKTAYIPVENHNVMLRHLITREEAETKIREWKEAGVWMLDQTSGEETGQPVREQDTISWRLQCQMADTLPREECRMLYEQSEADYVINQKSK